MAGSGRWLIWSLALLIALMVASPRSAVWAEAVGSPASILEKGQWSMGLGGGALLKRGLTRGADAFVYQAGHFRGYGLTDWLSFYGKLGWAHLSVDDASIVKVKDPSTSNSFGENVFISAQLKGKLWRHVRRGWELDGSVQYTDIRARHGDKNSAKWSDWQFSTSLAKPIGRLTPYVGVKLSALRMHARVSQDGGLLQQVIYRGDGVVGPFVGSDFRFGGEDTLVVNLESSYVGGAEVDLSVAYVF